MKVIIADDEALEREVYRVLIGRHFPELQVAAEVETGRQAIEAHDLHQPDLMLIDVKMPGINGIEAIDELRKRNTRTRFIVVSAYNFFDYAKEALKHGVEYYLLKPVAKEEFINAVGSVLQKIEYERRLNKESLELKERLKSILPVLETEAAIAIMMGDDERIMQFSSVLDVDISSGYIAVGMIDEKSFNPRNEVERNAVMNRIQVFIKDNIPELKPCLISNFISSKMVFIFPSGKNKSDFEARDAAYKKMLGIRNAVRDNFSVKIRFGIGEPYGSLNEIRNSYNQAYTVISNIESFGMDVVHYGDIKNEAFQEFHYPYELEKQLLEKVRLGITEQAVRIFVDIFDYTAESLKGNERRVKFELLELYFALSRMAYEVFVENGELKDFVMSKEMYFNSVTLQEIYRIFEEDIRNISNKFREERRKRTKSILYQAVQYISDNYMKEVSLEEVAKRIGLSPNYFSRLFKNEFNQSFIDYLTYVRVEAAKELMLKSSKSISDVSWEVGYSDPNYFTKVFKKVSGLTPSEFKEKTLIKEGI